MVNDNDLRQMSHITFDEFNNICQIINPEECCGELFQRYSACIEEIMKDFKYPHYYNGLIALLLLFSNDDSYDLNDHSRIEYIFQETKELAITGYEDFVGFNMESLNRLVFSLREMSNIFRAHYGSYQSEMPNLIYNEINTEECFEDKNGIRTQIKPVDFSKENSCGNKQYGIIDLYQHIPNVNTLHCDEYINDIFKKFQMSYASLTSGFVLTTIIGKPIYYIF